MPASDMSLPVSPLPFAQSWSLANTQQLLEHNLAAPDFDNNSDTAAIQAWRKKYQELTQSLELAIGRHVLSLAAQGKISNAPHTEAASHPFIDAWRRAVKLEDLSGWQAITIGRHLSKAFLSLFHRSNPKFNAPGEPMLTVQQLHQGLCDLAEHGNFESFDTSPIQCQTSSMNLILTVNGWQPSFERYDPQSGHFFELKEGDIVAPVLQHTKIPVPSGKMLASDWFRTPEFKALCDELIDDSVSINSPNGCALRTRQYAEKMGVVHVFVGDSSPEIISGPGGVCVGRIDEDSSDDKLAIGSSQGRVCTDLWWTTIVDKQILVDLLSRKMSPDLARDTVEKLIVEQDSDIVEFDLPPGEYHLYYTGNHEQFVQLFDRSGVDFSGVKTPMFLLWKDELPLLTRPKNKRKP